MGVMIKLRIAVIGALCLALPLGAVTAAVRAGSAVPAATAATIDPDCEQILRENRKRVAKGLARISNPECGFGLADNGMAVGSGMATGGVAASTAAAGGVAWPAIGVIVSTIATAISIESRTSRGRGTGFSR